MSIPLFLLSVEVSSAANGLNVFISALPTVLATLEASKNILLPLFRGLCVGVSSLSVPSVKKKKKINFYNNRGAVD